MIKLGLIGKNIQHSKSPAIYKKLLRTPFSYDLLDYPSERNLPDLKAIMPPYFGINITSPYKKHFFHDVVLTESAKDLGAINCLKFTEGKVYGENTDYLAIFEILQGWKATYTEIEVVVLGDGVMSSVTQVALSRQQIPFIVLSRKKTEHFSQVNVEAYFNKNISKKIVINACAREFVFRGKINKDTIFWDFNYDFTLHDHLKEQCHYIDGMPMLELQAKYAIAFWSII